MRRAFVIVLIAACSRPSFRDSIAALCDADAGPTPANLDAWLDDHIRERDGKDFVTVIKDMRPWMRRRQILRAGEDQHVADCKPIGALAGMRAPLGIDVPDVSGLEAGVQPIDDGAPFIAMTTTGIDVDTKPFTLDANGRELATRLVRNIVGSAHRPVEFATVAAAKTTTLTQLLPVLEIARAGGVSRVRIVVTVGDTDRTVEIDAPRARAGDIDAATSLVLTKAQLLGHDVRVDLSAGRAALRTALGKIPAGTLSLLCEPEATVDALATVLAAAHATGHDAQFAIPPPAPIPMPRPSSP